MSKSEIVHIKLLVFQIILGLYHGYNISYNKRFMIKLLCVMIVGVNAYMNITNPAVEITQSMTKAIHYITLACIAIYTENNYLSDYYKFDELIDNIKQRKKWNKKIYKIFTVFLIVAITIFVSYYFFIILHNDVWTNNIPAFISYMLIRLAIEVGYVPVILIFVLFYYRVKVFCYRLCQDIHKNDSFDWKKNAQTYIYILNSLKRTDFPVKLMIFLRLTSGFIEVNRVQFRLFTIVKLERRLAAILQAVFVYSILFIPVVLIEMTAEELDKQKKNIANKMITVTNERTKNEYRKILEFLKQDPLKYVLWRTVPIDAQLPLRFISISVTCVICLLQFTHVWDTNVANTTSHF